MVCLFGCRRRIQTKISALLWLLGINYLSPCSSKTFWWQSHWSCAAGSCVDWTWSISSHLPRLMRIQSSFNNWQWIDTWRPKFEQKTICVLLACWSKRRRPQRSRQYWLLCTASCPIRAKQLEKGIRIRYFGLILILESSKKGWSSVKQDRTQLFFKGHLPANCIVRAEKWRKNGMKGIICRLVHHQRSLWGTISIGIKDKIRVLQLNIDQSGNSFNNHLEKQFNLVLPSQPNPLNPLKIVWGNPLLKRLLVCCKKSSVLLIDRGNPWQRKNNMSEITMDQGNLIERKNSTQCKKTVISKIVIMWTSLTLRQTMRTLTSTSPAFLTKRWNPPKTSTFCNWFGESHVTHSKKPFRTTSNNINHSMHSATSRRLLSWMQETLRFARLSTWSRSGNARCVLSIAVQDLYSAHVDILWQTWQLVDPHKGGTRWFSTRKVRNRI